MTLKKATGLAALVLAVLALTRIDAAAQAPTLSVTVNGSQVTIAWTALPGATGYRLEAGSASGGTDIAVVNGPASITQVVVAAPAGTYFIRVRGTAGSLVGPASNEVAISVGGSNPGPGPGPAPCGQVAAPTLAATVTGPVVQFAWAAVPGAAGYRLELSRSPGGTELARTLSAATTSRQEVISLTGTFYARLVVGDNCGATATSPEISFTVESLAGSGPRTPDPLPGTALPLPAYGAAVAAQMAALYPGDLRNSCREHGGNNTWLFRLVQALRTQDSRWGLNWKRGNVGDMSQDVVTYNFGSSADEGTTNVYIIDTIGGHCGNSPSWNWQDQTQATRNGGTIGRWTLLPYVSAGFPPDQK
ncbi:MAG: fibronectin type III domain-containing protein [Vicinamibacterales bacterium]